MTNIQFSSDFIIAYPGENENDFKDTLKLIEEVKFINSFSFIFSPKTRDCSIMICLQWIRRTHLKD